MADLSHLDKKYFIDNKTFNCSFCNRRNVIYSIKEIFNFDWSETKTVYGFIAKCSSCHKESMHLASDQLCDWNQLEQKYYVRYSKSDIDDVVFYSVPSSFYVVDGRIPKIFRELITEAEGCLKMNYLTGASACVRKAIYELIIKENAQGQDYEEKIKSLKSKYSSIDPTYFDVLSHIQEMTSDKIHEQSWDKWDSKHLKLFLETLKNVLHEIYVIPKKKKNGCKRFKKF